jgi:hypothetical protein
LSEFFGFIQWPPARSFFSFKIQINCLACLFVLDPHSSWQRLICLRKGHTMMFQSLPFSFILLITTFWSLTIAVTVYIWWLNIKLLTLVVRPLNVFWEVLNIFVSRPFVSGGFSIAH